MAALGTAPAAQVNGRLVRLFTFTWRPAPESRPRLKEPARRLRLWYGGENQLAVNRLEMWSALLISMILIPALALAAHPPCDRYPPSKQSRCAIIWKELNDQDGPIIAQFGLDQLKRREEGKINARQHLAENMAFIKQSTEKRLKRLKERMEKE